MNHYQVLGVDRGAEAAVIEAAYRAMMRRYHPDVYPGPKVEAEQKSRALNAAYEILKNPEKRREYDASLGPAPQPWQAAPTALPNSSIAPRRRVFPLAVIASAIAVAVFGFAYLRSQPAAISQVAVAPNAPAAPAAVPPTPTAPVLSEKPATEQSCRGIQCRTMTPFGWAGIEAGVMTGPAESSSGLRIIDDGHYTDTGDGSCLSYKVVGGPENLRMLVEQGVVTTVEAYFDPKMPVFQTDRGVKLGDSEKAVRSVYPSLKQLPDIYSAPPDKKLFYYEPGGERGIRFDINDGRVSGISVGTTSIEYVEGCL